MAGFYLHIPFCVKKCAYCDFYSETDTQKIADYVLELQREIVRLSKRFPDKNVETVYFGGGTPGLLSAEQVDRILKTVQNNFDYAPKEVTLEFNPSSARDFTEYRDAGVTRASVGVQSLNDRTLRKIGRLHTAEEAVKTLEAAKNAGLRVSADLIIGLPEEDEDDLQRFIDGVQSFVGHVSAYLLKLEAGTPLTVSVSKGEIEVADDDRQAELYEYAYAELEKKGFERYEIGNFARRGEESLHNLNYWQMGEYFGAGAAAHSFLKGRRFYNPPNLASYLAGNHGGNRSEVAEDALKTLRERRAEAVMLALRTRDGLSVEEYRERFGGDFFQDFSKGFEAAKAYLNYKNGIISLKNEYFLLENAILGKLLQ